MVDELRQALRERQSAQEQLSKLKNLSTAGEITKEQFQKLGKEYQQRIQTADQMVNSIKDGIRSKLAVLRPTLGAYEGQLNRLKRELAEGKWTQEQYQQQVQKLAGDRARFIQKEQIALLETMAKAESPDALVGLVAATAPQSEFQPSGISVPAGGQLGNTTLRILMVIAGCLLIIGMVLPLMPADIESGFRTGQSPAGMFYGTMRNLREMNPEMSIFGEVMLLPLACGILILLLSAIKHGKLRGILIIPVAIAFLGGLCALLALVITYPLPILDEISTALKEPSGWKPALVVFAAGAGLLWVALFGHFLRSIGGLAACAVLLLATVAVSIGLGMTPETRAHSKLTLTLRSELPKSNSEDTLDLTIDATNYGNIEALISTKESLRKASNRYRLSLLQKFVENGEWQDVSQTCFETNVTVHPMGNEDPSYNTAIFTLSLPKPKYLEKAWLRIRAEDPFGVPVESQAVELVLKTKPPDPPKPEPIPTTAEIEKKLTDETRKKVDEIRLKLTSAKAGTLLTSIQDARDDINQINAEADRDRLNTALNEAILSAKDRQADELFKRASESFQGESYERAALLAKQVLEIYENEPKTVPDELTDTGNSIYSDAQTLLHDARMAKDPALRYVVTGIFQKSTGQTTVFLLDNVTQQTFKVGMGEAVNDCTVETITKSSVRLKRGADTFEIQK